MRSNESITVLRANEEKYGPSTEPCGTPMLRRQVKQREPIPTKNYKHEIWVRHPMEDSAKDWPNWQKWPPTHHTLLTTNYTSSPRSSPKPHVTLIAILCYYRHLMSTSLEAYCTHLSRELMKKINREQGVSLTVFTKLNSVFNLFRLKKKQEFPLSTTARPVFCC